MLHEDRDLFVLINMVFLERNTMPRMLEELKKVRRSTEEGGRERPWHLIDDLPESLLPHC